MKGREVEEGERGFGRRISCFSIEPVSFYERARMCLMGVPALQYTDLACTLRVGSEPSNRLSLRM